MIAAKEDSTSACMRGIDWLASHFDVKQNLGHGQQYKNYYLYGLERAGRLAGLRFFGRNDWYRSGAEELVRTQNKLSGFWSGNGQENELVGDQLRPAVPGQGPCAGPDQQALPSPRGDWNNDPDDVRNMVERRLARLEKPAHLAGRRSRYAAIVQDMLQAPIAFFNGHHAPVFNAVARQNLPDFVEQGGFIFAEACCGRTNSTGVSSD